MPIADRLSSGDPVSLLVDVMVGSEFHVKDGAHPGVVVGIHLADIPSGNLEPNRLLMNAALGGGSDGPHYH